MIDIVRLNIKAGNGGNGCTSFLREKYRPKGGPNGGDGGDGGNAYLLGDPGLNTLLHLKFNSTINVERGGHGKGKEQRGVNGAPQYIHVPIGTQVSVAHSDGGREVVADIVGETPYVVAQGGKGGWGNRRYATPTNQVPMLSQKGERGESIVLYLELKLLADVGILARPNAGKSTLISRCSAAKPRVASYPFTTVEPVLAVVEVRGRDFVMMEVPGLLEGAHRGVGLGHQFLRHAERARLYIHLLDGTAEDPADDYAMLNNELERFNADLLAKPQIVVVNKLDVTEVKEQESDIRDRLQREMSKRGSLGLDGHGPEVLFISAVTGEAVEMLLNRVMESLDALPKPQELADVTVGTELRRRSSSGPEMVYHDGEVFVVESDYLERLTALADTRDHRVITQVWLEMRKRGLAGRLVEAGIEAGDTIRIGRVEVEWF